MRRLVASAGGRARVIDTHPATVGGPGCDIVLEGVADDDTLLLVALDADEPFVQPAASTPAADVVCNDRQLTASAWLRDGDTLEIAGNRFLCSVTDTEVRLEMIPPDGPAPFEPPSVPAPPAEIAYISPVDFTPARSRRSTRLGFRFRPRLVWALLLLGVLAACSWYLLTATAIEIIVDPEPDSLAVRGLLPIPEIAGTYLLRPGRYQVTALKDGYTPLDEEIEITPEGGASIRRALSPRGVGVTVLSHPVDGAEVAVDGQVVGTTPLADLELGPGEHHLVVTADRHRPATATLRLHPGDPPQEIEIELVPDWAPVTISSTPPGARIFVDGSARGTTPATLELVSGRRHLELRLSGRRPHRRSLDITAGRAASVGPVDLEPADGVLFVTSQPAGATVTVDGVYAGRTPLEVATAPEEEHLLKLSLVGHATRTVEARVAASSRSEVQVVLEPLSGTVGFSSQPPGAELVVDGEVRGSTDLELELPARPHAVEIRLNGYSSFTTTVTPDPNLEQTVRAVLRAEGPASLPPVITTSQDAQLTLIGPGRFTMGAPRREPGRRANEVLREVEITRSYYLGVREVTNREYREFAENHRSGAAGSHTLETDHHPVVRVTWENAARYCNWLSEREGLPPVYVERSGALVPRSPLPTGYRLPTEAEWAWAARYPDGATPRKYGWGSSATLPADAGNYGDGAARPVIGEALPGYRDGYTTTAPSGSFSSNPLGLFNLGGNVAEWVHDFYSPMPGTPGALASDPQGPGQGAYHVIRGAGWMDNELTELRLTHRDYGADPRPDVGFRVARSAEP